MLNKKPLLPVQAKQQRFHIHPFTKPAQGRRGLTSNAPFHHSIYARNDRMRVPFVSLLKTDELLVQLCRRMIKSSAF